MKRAVFWTALIAGTMMVSSSAMAIEMHRGPFHKPDHGFPGFPGNNHHHNNNGGGNNNNAPLPIAALGLPIAAGLVGYAIRRKKA